MKYIKAFGLPVIVSVALMAATAPASATLTEAPGDPVEAGDVFHAQSEGATSLDGTVDIACGKSTLSGTISANGGTSGVFNAVSFSECSNDTVTVQKGGSFSIATDGTFRSTGLSMTVQLHRTVLGFPITTHCLFETNNTSIGKITLGFFYVRIHVGTNTILVGKTDSACGSNAEWTGSYGVSSPAYLGID